jgi:hypothetical protein
MLTTNNSEQYHVQLTNTLFCPYDIEFDKQPKCWVNFFNYIKNTKHKQISSEDDYYNQIIKIVLEEDFVVTIKLQRKPIKDYKLLFDSEENYIRFMIIYG